MLLAHLNKYHSVVCILKRFHFTSFHFELSTSTSNLPREVFPTQDTNDTIEMLIVQVRLWTVVCCDVLFQVLTVLHPCSLYTCVVGTVTSNKYGSKYCPRLNAFASLVGRRRRVG